MNMNISNGTVKGEAIKLICFPEFFSLHYRSRYQNLSLRTLFVVYTHHMRSCLSFFIAESNSNVHFQTPVVPFVTPTQSPFPSSENLIEAQSNTLFPHTNSFPIESTVASHHQTIVESFNPLSRSLSPYQSASHHISAIESQV